MPVVNLGAAPDSTLSSQSHILVDELFLTSQLEGWKHNTKADEVKASSVVSRTKLIKTGQLDGKISANGHAKMAPGASAYELRRRLGKAKPVCAILPWTGLSVGKVVTIQPSYILDSTVEVKENETVKIDLELGAGADFVDGQMLISPRDLVPAGTTFLSAAIENTEATTFGGLWSFHVLAIEGTGSPTVTPSLVASADTTYTPCGDAGVSMSKPGAQFMAIPSPLPILAKVKASLAITGTITALQCAFAFGRFTDPEA